MFPKAYIFYTVPNAKLYLHVKTDKTSNVTLSDYSPYLKHHPDVHQMWDVARYQHPLVFFKNVLVIPDVDPGKLTYAHLIKNDEVIYCVSSESDLKQLESIASEIDRCGTDYSRIPPDSKYLLSPLTSYVNKNQEEHDLLHEAINRHFIQSQFPA
jgi:hypothetical protein